MLHFAIYSLRLNMLIYSTPVVTEHQFSNYVGVMRYLNAEEIEALLSGHVNQIRVSELEFTLF